jgi:hypothetical protein
MTFQTSGDDFSPPLQADPSSVVIPSLPRLNVGPRASLPLANIVSSSPATIQRTAHERKESERFKGFTYEELTKRDKLNLDIFWLEDESLEDSANLPDPDIIAAEIVEDLQAALAQFAEIAADLKK